MSIYVERLIRAPIDALWTHTQDPALHERWDLRFSQIDYLPRSDPSEPQGFRYTTRLGFGVSVSGEGTTVGERTLPDGSQTSALRFGSDQARSLIREGRGYWKYIPTTAGVRFLTSYDYTTRYGVIGALFDRLAFRPLMGWATAWSFDRLRLWLEEGADPARVMRQAIAHGVARIGLAATFAYHGIVPKLLGPAPDELALLQNTGVPGALVGPAIVALGVAEVLLAIALLVFWHQAWPALVCLVFAVVATVGVAITSPGYLGAAFNPITLNLGIGCLAAIDLLTIAGLPSAGRCRRRPEPEVP
ncbi:MAG TPA: DoxX-like family protein [Candidatus Limnocylindrales bacterium]|nr:DoxX-like family protein [Candidatus Limnocylindrales bacterium]